MTIVVLVFGDIHPHTAFIIGAYAMTVLVILGLTSWIVLDYRAQKRILADLEMRGFTRRSARGDEPKP